MKLYRSVLILVAILLADVPSAFARLTASGALADAPSQVFPLLDRNTRLDMIDYFNSGSKTPSQNALQGKSRITSLSPDMLTMTMTDASTYDIIVLPAGNDSIIAVIQTLATPAHDSNISFYSRKWNKLNGDYFTQPKVADWLSPQGKKASVNLETLIPFMLVSYTYNPETSTLTLTNNLAEFLSPDVYSMVSDALLPTMTYRWNGKKMERQQ
jgi:hypothetical protein